MTEQKLREALEPLKREERYIVIKRKYLHPMIEASLRNDMRDLGISTVECVVIESDWPEYETVWRMIEDRVTGRALSLPKGEQDAGLVEKVARAISLCSVCEGEGTVADGLDEAACSTPCPPCFGTGYDAQAVLQALSPHLSEREKTNEKGPVAVDHRPYHDEWALSWYDEAVKDNVQLAYFLQRFEYFVLSRSSAISRGDHAGGEGR